MSELKEALEFTNLSIKKFDPRKTRPLYTDAGPITIRKFREKLFSILGKNVWDYPEIVKTLNDDRKMESLVVEYLESEGCLSVEKDDGSSSFSVPDKLKHLTLNIDRSAKDSGAKRFFCTTKEELVDPGTSGQYFLESCRISLLDGVQIARAVIPKYLPRSVRGVHSSRDEVTGRDHNYFNTYIPPEWSIWKDRNKEKWDKLPAKPHKEIITLLRHLIPNKAEREYFYAWVYTSMTSRSFVYLVLCGDPGVGKNRLKLLLSALHGSTNSIDGKKETFGANETKFNSQMEDNTLIWFDELKYGPDMEPRMKEYQNTSIAIERKGVDATASSCIYSSMVISNNYPRDNYLLFNSRKFAPLVLGNGPLTTALEPEEIAELSGKIDPRSDNFDVAYVAQLAKWILAIGGKYCAQFPNLEYQGPKYWELAHTSMSRWQKIAVLSLTTENSRGKFPGWDEEKESYLWSKVEEALRRKKEYESKDYRDPATVRTFFETYRDTKGAPVFEVERISNSAVQDFWVRPLVSIVKVVAGKVVEKSEKLKRPPGLSEFKWRKMKEEFEANNEKDDL